MRRAWLAAFAVALVASACAGLQLGHEFPSPDSAQIKVNATDKSALLAFFGEPYQVGIDSGEQTWRHGEVLLVHVELSRRHAEVAVAL